MVTTKRHLHHNIKSYISKCAVLLGLGCAAEQAPEGGASLAAPLGITAEHRDKSGHKDQRRPDKWNHSQGSEWKEDLEEFEVHRLASQSRRLSRSIVLGSQLREGRAILGCDRMSHRAEVSPTLACAKAVRPGPEQPAVLTGTYVPGTPLHCRQCYVAIGRSHKQRATAPTQTAHRMSPRRATRAVPPRDLPIGWRSERAKDLASQSEAAKVSGIRVSHLHRQAAAPA